MQNSTFKTRTRRGWANDTAIVAVAAVAVRVAVAMLLYHFFL